MKTILEVKNLCKTYILNKRQNNVLKNVNFTITDGEMVAVMGPSGSGKSTLLYAVSGMDKITAGDVYFQEKNIANLPAKELAGIRLDEMGFVFQQMYMLKNLSVLDNIILPACQSKKNTASRKEKVQFGQDLMRKLGIIEIADNDVNEVSGGQLQRACICRSMVNHPKIIFADEPTGALNRTSSEEVMEELAKMLFESGHSHFLEMSGGDINATELIASLINQKKNLIEGIRYALESVDGSVSMLLMNEKGIYAARDKYGRTPVVIGKKEEAFCISFENFAYRNLGYRDYKELGPGEIVLVTNKECVTLSEPGKDMKICTFLWVYYGYPASSYEGVSVEQMRYECGKRMAQRDHVSPDIAAGVPDSGTAHAIRYANESGIPFSRPFIKYTPTWPRSFMPAIQSQRDLIAKMKLLAVEELIRDKSLLLIDDSIVIGTQLRETTEFLLMIPL